MNDFLFSSHPFSSFIHLCSSSCLMLRTTSKFFFAGTLVRYVGNGPTFQTGGEHIDACMIANAHPLNERGIRSSSPFPEPNTAVYDTYQPWTYFHPIDVKIDKLPAPNPKYFQKHTKRHWDLSATELLEIQSRRKYFQVWGYGLVTVFVYFLMPKEKSFSGLRGADGHWVLLPKFQPEKF